MTNKKVLKTQKAKLTPKSDTAAIKAKVDESTRLREIRAIVKANNKSNMSESMVICQIYKESAFNKNAGVGKHNAKGLMQMQVGAVKQVFKNRRQKELGHMPSDKDTAQAFSDAEKFYSSDKMLDEAQNISIGTEYLQYCIDSTKSIESGYRKYRGTNEIYYEIIKKCAEELDKEPDNVQILHKLHN